MRSLSILVSCVALASGARADQLCSTASTAQMPTNWSTTVMFPRFDPNLGTLNSVNVSLTGSLSGSCGVENLDIGPVTLTTQVAATVTLVRADMSIIEIVIPFQDFVDSLSAFDGVIDFGGTSGAMHTGVTAMTTAQTNLTSAVDLALFTGLAGNPGALGLPIIGQDSCTVSGLGNPIDHFVLQALGAVTICYDYTPVAIPFCAGDGLSAVACPCGNSSPVGARVGCLHSLGLGASLRGTGTASLLGDTLTLRCTDLPPTATGLYFQGTARVNAGDGTPFGDGLLCAGGTVVRVAIKTAASGLMSYPEAGDVPISVRGNVAPNSRRYYQVWYRNSASFCTSAAFNLTNGVEVHWVP